MSQQFVVGLIIDTPFPITLEMNQTSIDSLHALLNNSSSFFMSQNPPIQQVTLQLWTLGNTNTTLTDRLLNTSSVVSQASEPLYTNDEKYSTTSIVLATTTTTSVSVKHETSNNDNTLTVQNNLSHHDASTPIFPNENVITSAISRTDSTAGSPSMTALPLISDPTTSTISSTERFSEGSVSTLAIPVHFAPTTSTISSTERFSEGSIAMTASEPDTTTSAMTVTGDEGITQPIGLYINTTTYEISLSENSSIGSISITKLETETTTDELKVTENVGITQPETGTLAVNISDYLSSETTAPNIESAPTAQTQAYATTTVSESENGTLAVDISDYQQSTAPNTPTAETQAYATTTVSDSENGTLAVDIRVITTLALDSYTQTTIALSVTESTDPVMPVSENVNNNTNTYYDAASTLTLEAYSTTAYPAYYPLSPSPLTTSIWIENVCWLNSCSGGVGPSCICIPGFAPLNQTAQCAPCPAGTYKPTYGFEKCQRCPGGLISESLISSSKCVPCDQGYFAMPNGKDCMQCPDGIIAHSTEMDLNCLAMGCDAGYVLSNDRRRCAICPLNWFQQGQACIPCNSGEYTESEGSVECLESPSLPPPDTTKNDTSPSTKNESTDTGPATCPQGSIAFYNRDQVQQCMACPLNWFQQGQACIPCNSGEYTESEGSVECLESPPLPPNQDATKNESTNLSALCPNGSIPFYYRDQVQQCMACPLNWFQLGQACIPCNRDTGQYTESEGSMKCLESSPSPWPPDSDTRSNTTCPKGSISYTRNQSKYCIPCQAGWYQDKEQLDTCIPCPVGQYTSQEGSTTCKACEEGTFSNISSASQCTACSLGNYANTIGQTACKQCPEGRYSTPVIGGVECHHYTCTPNYYFSPRVLVPLTITPEYEGCIECTICDSGFFINKSCSNHEDTQCMPCTETCPHRSTLTRYCTLYSDSECTAICMPGEMKVNGTMCVPCPPGTMLDTVSEGSCTSCPNGKYSGDEGSTTCQVCNLPLSFPNGIKTACVQTCEVGSIINLLDNADPQATSMLYCEQCLPGTFHDHLHTGTCTPCPANSFSGEKGQISCKSCPSEDSSASLPGSAACTLQTCNAFPMMTSR